MLRYFSWAFAFIYRFMKAMAFVLGWLLLAGGIAGGWIWYSKTHRAITIPPVAVVKLTLDGAYLENTEKDVLGGMLGAEPSQSFFSLVRGIDAIGQDARIKGVMLVLQDPLLTQVQYYEVFQALNKLRQQGKFIHVYAAEAFVSKASTYNYLLASVADKITVFPLAGLSFKGLGGHHLFYRGLFDKLGVQIETVRFEAYKSAPEAYERSKMSPENREMLESLIGDLGDLAVKTLASSVRGKGDEKRVMEWFQEDVFLPQEAQQLGLVDTVGSQESADKKALEKAGKKAKFVEFNAYIAHLEKRKISKKQGIALVTMQGLIVEGNATARGGKYRADFERGPVIEAEKVLAKLKEVEENPLVRAVVVRIDSPGGDAFASRMIYDALCDLEKKGKPVFISMGDLAASGGYMISLAGRRFASPATLTGSIGVYTYKAAYKGLLDLLGVSVEKVQEAEKNAPWSSFEPFSEKQRQGTEKFLGHIYKDFLELTSKACNMPLEKARAAAQGRVWTGRQALNLGLVHQHGTLMEVLDYAKQKVGLKSSAPVILYANQRPLLQRLLDLFMDDQGALSWATFGRRLGCLLVQGVVQEYTQEPASTYPVKMQAPLAVPQR